MINLFKSLLSLLLSGGVLLVSAAEPSPAAQDRLRVMIETDAGGDPDDEQSLVRFLLYANEWDVEGIIANRAQARERENLHRERTGIGIVRSLIDAYGGCHSNLVQHDARFPRPEALQKVTVSGNADSEAGVDLIIAAVDSADARPIWFCNWGTDHGSAPSSLKRALDRVLRERGADGYARFKSRLRLSSDNQFGDHTTPLAPPFALWIDAFRPEIDRKRWYHRFSAITATAGGFDIERDVRTGHGPLGAFYPLNTTHRQKEGDSMTFLYLVPTGMNDPAHPNWGSWGGRYGPNETFPGKPYHWANQQDAWRGTTNRDNNLARWAAHMQNDFKARMDWCVQPFEKANHRPNAVLNGDHTSRILELNATEGSVVSLSASGSADRDGDALSYDWTVYPEAGTCSEPISLETASSPQARLLIPRNSAGKTIHVILTVTDDGDPPLVSYRRVVVQCR